MNGKILCAAVLVGFAICAPASTQADTTVAPASATIDRDKVQAAYELAIKCFVAAGHGSINRHKANDPKRASYYDDQAKHSWYTALRLSGQLGYDTDQFQADVKAISDRELPHLANDPVYFRQVAEECKAYGLM